MRWIGQIFLGSTFALCFWMCPRRLARDARRRRADVGSAGAQSTSADLLFQAGVWIAIAFFAVVRFLSYIDRRIRLEGWEIELRLRRSAAPRRRDSIDLSPRDHRGAAWALGPNRRTSGRCRRRRADRSPRPAASSEHRSARHARRARSRTRSGTGNIPGTIPTPTVSSRSGRPRSHG